MNGDYRDLCSIWVTRKSHEELIVILICKKEYEPEYIIAVKAQLLLIIQN